MQSGWQDGAGVLIWRCAEVSGERVFGVDGSEVWRETHECESVCGAGIVADEWWRRRRNRIYTWEEVGNVRREKTKKEEKRNRIRIRIRKNNQTRKILGPIVCHKHFIRVQLKVEPPESMTTLLDILHNRLDHLFVLFCTLSMNTPLILQGSDNQTKLLVHRNEEWSDKRVKRLKMR